ncbi:DNA gyrase subunit A [Candidatus Woesearchaeota archaeon]|nr:DNA gyrase subunit A [Candidatus Woesearchaeota archaeon]
MPDEQNPPSKIEEPSSSQTPEEMPKGHVILRPIEEEMRQSYLDYAMSVIIGRALPDARDGLKPVHRRILYAMYDMGMTHNKPFKKSARIVGECFVKNTLVLTEKGLLPIQDIEKGMKVYTQSGQETVSELYIMPQQKLLRISLENGIENVVTHGQMFKVLIPSWDFVWKEAKDLTPDDYIVMKSEYPQVQKEISIGNKKLSKGIAYMLGQLLSDGWVGMDKRGYHRLFFYSTSFPVVERVFSVLQTEFDYTACIESKDYELTTAAGQVLLKKAYQIRINKKEINDFLIQQFQLLGIRAETKKIPSQILQSPKEIIFSFISGLIDGDGSIHKERTLIHYGSVSKELAQQLLVVLQHFDIHGKMYVSSENKKGGFVHGRQIYARKKFFSLEFSGLSAQKLAEQLSLAEERKKERAMEILSHDLGKSSYEILPFGSKKIFEELSRFHLGGGWYEDASGKKFRAGVQYPSGVKIRYSEDLRDKPLRISQIIEWGICEKLKKLGSDLHVFLEKVIQNKLSFMRVKNVSCADEQTTYDIQVENKHEFVANGMMSHNCLGKYHPHGDMAVYDSLVRMAQPFSLRYMFIHGQGNFGSVDGDNAASMRYTEARLQKIAEEMLQDLDKETVLMTDNFDGSLKEPSVLPGKVPSLLINGSNGIAVGMATNIPPHNLGEIAEAVVLVIDNPDAGVAELLQVVKGPDFPTGGIIIGKSGILSAFAKGYGKVQVKAKIHVEEKAGRYKIIVDEIPYMVNKAMLIEEIAEYVKEKVILGIADLRDESDKDGMRIVIEVKKDTNMDVLQNQLFKHTRMQVTFAINMLALVNNEPKTLSLKEALVVFIEHRKDVITKRTQYDMRKAEEKAHILQGLIVALNDIDRAIALIKGSTSAEKARVALMIAYSMSEIQAQAILDMKLQKLTSLEQNKIREEHGQLLEMIKDYKDILATPQRVLNFIKTEMNELKEAYGDARKTEIVDGDDEDIDDESLIENTKMVVTITQAGYIKRLPVDTYKQQNRGGKGIIATTTKEEDVVEDLFVADNKDTILFFTNTGIVHWLKVYEIPEGTRQAKGKAIVNLLNLEPNVQITAAIPIKQFKENNYLLMATKNGTIKKTSLIAYSKPRAGGIIAITLDAGDYLVNVLLTDGAKEILLATRNGLAVRFHESQARPIGRSGMGVCGISLKGDDYVIAMVDVNPQKTILTMTENGYGKRTAGEEYRLINRGGIGVINIQCSERNGPVVAVASVSEEDDIMLISQSGITIRIPAKGISVIGRNTQGVRLMKLEDTDKVVACAKIAREEMVEMQEKKPAI